MFSAIGKVQGLAKVSPSEETSNETGQAANETEKPEEQTSGGAGFFSAFSKIGITGISSSGTMDNIANAEAKTPTEEAELSDEKKKETWGNSLSNAFNKVGKVATDYSKGISIKMIFYFGLCLLSSRTIPVFIYCIPLTKDFLLFTEHL